MFHRCLNAQIPRGYFTDVTNVGQFIDENTFEFLPSVSDDGLTLYFSDAAVENLGIESRQGGKGAEDIWMATRNTTEEPFKNAVNLDGINSEQYETMGSVGPDGTLYFGSNRNGSWKIYEATRSSENGAYDTATLMAGNINSEDITNSPRITPDGLTMIFHRSPATSNFHRDIWIAERASVNEPFLDVSKLPETVNQYHESMPSISSDGLTVFYSDWDLDKTLRPGLGGWDIWVTTRPDKDGEFGTPVGINELFPGTEINGAGFEGNPYISPDWPAPGSKLYFVADGNGASDVFQATWVAESSQNAETYRIIIPSEFATTEAPGVADNLPTDYRLQQLYHASDFESLPIEKGLITHIRWRTDGNLDVPLSVSADQMTARLSTTEKAAESLDQTFAVNIGIDETVVFDRRVDWDIQDASPQGGPRDFEFTVPLEKSFPYDPQKGNLLLDLTVRGGSERLGLDFSGGPTATTTLIWTGSSGVITGQGDGVLLGGHVAEFVVESADCNRDLLIDVFDANCASPASIDGVLALAGIVQGDLDGNGIVEFADFLILSNSFGAAGNYTDGDLDGSGEVTFGDFLILSNSYGMSSGTSAVPEPIFQFAWCLFFAMGLQMKRKSQRHSLRRQFGRLRSLRGREGN